jgi:shikimate dehydrogenase
MVDKYAVIGNPIAHSKSPLIHEAFAKQTAQAISYERVLAPLDGFSATVQDLVAKGYKGVNVTVPFKFEAYDLANQLMPHALDAGAANTLLFSNQGIVADNTDGAGLVRDITQNLKQSIAGKRVLLLGAGGAAEGVLHPILACEPSMLVIANRSLDKALSMVKKVASSTLSLAACEFSSLQGHEFDIVINATSAGLTDTALPIPDTIFAKGCLAYDMMYGRETPFMAQARRNGARVADGLGMLIEQAAEAFYLWRNVRPETQPVIAMVRAL